MSEIHNAEVVFYPIFREEYFGQCQKIVRTNLLKKFMRRQDQFSKLNL